MGILSKKTVTVGELNRYIKELISGDDMLSGIWVQGEVSNLKYHSSGHVYFSLKDDRGIIKSVMFRSRSILMRFRLEEGMKVLAFGSVDVFEQGGQYQFYVDRIEPDGPGALYAAFEKLKERLASEGLFDTERKRPLPLLPECVGVVTSATGAVIQDIRNVAGRRFAEIPLLLYEVPVQGREAAPIIADAIKKAGVSGKCDVIIVARGGGSIEDLWPFNEECVARAIFECPVPVVSAVGHETDYTIADFVADLRAPTPSAAAELVIPEKSLLKATLSDLKIRLLAAPGLEILVKRAALERTAMRIDMSASGFTAVKRVRLQDLEKKVRSFNAENIILKKRAISDSLSERLKTQFAHNLDKRRLNLNIISEKLEALGPKSVLSRGYSIAVGKDGKTLTSVKDFEQLTDFELIMSDGRLEASVSTKSN